MCEEQMALSALNETPQDLKNRYIFHSKVCKNGYKTMEYKTYKYKKYVLRWVYTKMISVFMIRYK